MNKPYQHQQQTLQMKGFDKDDILNKQHFYGKPQSLLILRRVFCGWFACLLFITPAKLASVAFLSADFKLPLSEECAVNHQLETIAHSHFSSRSLLSSAFSFWSSVRKQVKQNSFVLFSPEPPFPISSPFVNCTIMLSVSTHAGYSTSFISKKSC